MNSTDQSTAGPESGPLVSRPRGHNESLKEEAMALLNTGQSIATVAAVLSIPQVQIRIWIHSSTASFKREILSRPKVDNRRLYDDAFKQEAFHLIEEGISIRKLSQMLSVSQVTLHKWKKELFNPEKVESARQNVSADSSATAAATTTNEANRLTLEIDSLRKEVITLRDERDVLKKALQILLRAH